MRIQAAIVACFTVPVLLVGQGGLKAGSLKPSAGTTLAPIDLDKMKGQPYRLAWSSDGSAIYLQMFEGDFGMRGRRYERGKQCDGQSAARQFHGESPGGVERPAQARS